MRSWMKMSQLKDIKTNLNDVLERVNVAYKTQSSRISPSPIMVAVSKFKPVEMIAEAYEAGQRHFGENYVQELEEKSKHEQILRQCPDIKWHFIGHLQSNKINKILQIPNLYMIQTVDSLKLATALHKALEKDEKALSRTRPLPILLQVNTSGEESKSGLNPSEVVTLYKHIRENLDTLQVQGLMEIGSGDFDYSQGLPNPDFQCLLDIREKILAEEPQVDVATFHISMGMSNDFEEAIKAGSTMVRVGRSIFGQRAINTEKSE